MKVSLDVRTCSDGRYARSTGTSGLAQLDTPDAVFRHAARPGTQGWWKAHECSRPDRQRCAAPHVVTGWCAGANHTVRLIDAKIKRKIENGEKIRLCRLSRSVIAGDTTAMMVPFTDLQR